MKNKKIFIKVLKKTLKVIGYTLGAVLGVVLLFFIYINLPVAASKEKAEIGVTFSSRYAQDINLNWREAYLAMLDDLKIRYIRIPVYWDLVEKSDGNYDFSDIDWQLAEAQKRDAKIILVVGQKVPRWPECFIPKWVGDDVSVKKEKLLKFEEVVINRYKNNHPEIARWQVENEPFLDFGVCPASDASLLDSEIAKVKSIDSSRPIVVTDSGELSLWIKAASRADVFGTTMYREVYSKNMGHFFAFEGKHFIIFSHVAKQFFSFSSNLCEFAKIFRFNVSFAVRDSVEFDLVFLQLLVQ